MVDIALLAGPLKIAIEVDGPHHDRESIKFKDAYKEHLLRKQGWTVIRVSYRDTARIANLKEKLSLLLEPRYSEKNKKPSDSMLNPNAPAVMPSYSNFRKNEFSPPPSTCSRLNPNASEFDIRKLSLHL